MQKQVVILSLSLAAVSTGTAVWLALRGPQASASPETSGSTRATAAASHSPAAAPDQKSGPAETPVTAAKLTREKGSIGVSEVVREDVQGSILPPSTRAVPAHISEVPPAELARRVEQIEKETNHEMRRLVGLLNLSEDQQDKVYEKLAASSRHWVPGMAIAADGGGVVIPDTKTTASTATDASEDIMSLLNADQADTLLGAEMDRAAWWAEIITQLDAQTDVPALDGGSTEGSVKAYEGADTLE